MYNVYIMYMMYIFRIQHILPYILYVYITLYYHIYYSYRQYIQRQRVHTVSLLDIHLSRADLQLHFLTYFHFSEVISVNILELVVSWFE